MKNWKTEMVTAFTTLSNGLLVMRFHHLMMLDWDVLQLAPLKAHGHCTAANRKEVELRLYNRCISRPKELWAIYHTHSGVHAFRLDKRLPVRCFEALETARTLNCDPLYLKYSWQRNQWSARVEPKPGRVLDRIHFKGFIGSGECHPLNLKELEVHHSCLIEHGMTFRNLLSPSLVLHNLRINKLAS